MRVSCSFVALGFASPVEVTPRGSQLFQPGSFRLAPSPRGAAAPWQAAAVHLGSWLICVARMRRSFFSRDLRARSCGRCFPHPRASFPKRRCGSRERGPRLWPEAGPGSGGSQPTVGWGSRKGRAPGASDGGDVPSAQPRMRARRRWGSGTRCPLGLRACRHVGVVPGALGCAAAWHGVWRTVLV